MWCGRLGWGCRGLGAAGSSCITNGKEDKQWRGNEMISRDGGEHREEQPLSEEFGVMAKQCDSLILWFFLR